MFEVCITVYIPAIIIEPIIHASLQKQNHQNSMLSLLYTNRKVSYKLIENVPCNTSVRELLLPNLIVLYSVER